MSERVNTEAVRHQLVQAYTRAVHPDVIGHLRAALGEFDGELEEELIACPTCGRLGMVERIRVHNCSE